MVRQLFLHKMIEIIVNGDLKEQQKLIKTQRIIELQTYTQQISNGYWIEKSNPKIAFDQIIERFYIGLVFRFNNHRY